MVILSFRPLAERVPVVIELQSVQLPRQRDKSKNSFEPLSKAQRRPCPKEKEISCSHSS